MEKPTQAQDGFINKLLKSDGVLRAIVTAILILMGGGAYLLWARAWTTCSDGAYFQCGVGATLALLLTAAVSAILIIIGLSYYLFWDIDDKKNEKSDSYMDKFLRSGFCYWTAVIAGFVLMGRIAYGFWSNTGLAWSAGNYFDSVLGAIPALLATAVIAANLIALLVLDILSRGLEEYVESRNKFSPSPPS